MAFQFRILPYSGAIRLELTSRNIIVTPIAFTVVCYSSRNLVFCAVVGVPVDVLALAVAVFYRPSCVVAVCTSCRPPLPGFCIFVDCTSGSPGVIHYEFHAFGAHVVKSIVPKHLLLALLEMLKRRPSVSDPHLATDCF